MSNQDRNILFIFCLETCKTAKTDQMYLIELLKHFYPSFMENSSIKRDYVYLNGKYNFNSASIRKQIYRKVKEYSETIGGEVVIIYILDKDKFDSKPGDRDFIANVEKYCSELGNELIWFVRNIEHVLLGRTIDGNKKVEIASRFRSSGQVRSIKKNETKL